MHSRDRDRAQWQGGGSSSLAQAQQGQHMRTCRGPGRKGLEGQDKGLLLSANFMCELSCSVPYSRWPIEYGSLPF